MSRSGEPLLSRSLSSPSPDNFPADHQVQHLVRSGQPGRLVRATGGGSQWYLAVSLSLQAMARGSGNRSGELTPVFLQPSRTLRDQERHGPSSCCAYRLSAIHPVPSDLWHRQYNGLDVPTALHHHVRFLPWHFRFGLPQLTVCSSSPRACSSTQRVTTTVHPELRSAEFLQDSRSRTSSTSRSNGELTGSSSSLSRRWLP